MANFEIAWNLSYCFESFSPLNNDVTEGVITTRSNRMKFRLTLRQKFINFWSFLTRPGDKHRVNMTKRSAIALRLPSWSKLKIFFIFSHDKTPSLMVFREISFWNEMFLCSIKLEMFTVLLLNRNWFSSCKRRELQAVQRRQQETSRRFCEKLVGDMLFKCD